MCTPTTNGTPSPSCRSCGEAPAGKGGICDACAPAEHYDYEAEADNDAFADACGQMTQADWDADNDWLASAGWGEM